MSTNSFPDKFKYDLRHVGRYMALADAQEELLAKPRGFAMMVYQVPDPITPAGLGVNGEAGYRAMRDMFGNRILLPTVAEIYDWDLVEDKEEDFRKLSDDYFALPSIFGGVTDLAEIADPRIGQSQWDGGVHLWSAHPLTQEQAELLDRAMARFMLDSPYTWLRDWRYLVEPWGSRIRLEQAAKNPAEYIPRSGENPDEAWDNAQLDLEHVKEVEKRLHPGLHILPGDFEVDFDRLADVWRDMRLYQLQPIWNTVRATRLAGMHGLPRALPRIRLAKDHFSWQ